MKPRSVISSQANTQIKNLMQLQKKAKIRYEQGVYVIEGIKMFEEAIEIGGLIKKAYVSQSFYEDKVRSCPHYFANLDYEIVIDSVFHEISETKTPQGIMAMVTMTHYNLEQMLTASKECFLLLEDIRDPGNLGTMIRTAEGAGITGVIMNASCVDIYNPKVIRSTMGSIYRVPFFYTEDFISSLNEIKKQGIHIFAAHLMGSDYDSLESFRKRCALLIGNEANGLSKEASNMADSLIKIPMAGKVESLNAAVAAAILMYEVARQRRRKT